MSCGVFTCIIRYIVWNLTRGSCYFRFVTEPLTMGLNIAQGEITHNANAASFKSFFSKSNGVTNCDTISKTKTEFFPTSECDHSSGLGTAVVKELRYKDNSYKVSLAPLQLATSL